DLPLDFGERLRRFNGNTHDQASSVCGSVVGYKALGRKLATKAKNAMRRVRGAGAVGRPRMRHVGKRWQTCAAGSKRRDAFDSFCPAGPMVELADQMLHALER